MKKYPNGTNLRTHVGKIPPHYVLTGFSLHAPKAVPLLLWLLNLYVTDRMGLKRIRTMSRALAHNAHSVGSWAGPKAMVCSLLVCSTLSKIEPDVCNLKIPVRYSSGDL